MATACVLNGRLYVMGGIFCNKLQVLEYSEENGFSWTVKADLPVVRHSAASVTHDGKLYLIGGYVNWQASSSVLVYDTTLDSWTAGPALQLPYAVTGGHAAVSAAGEIHLTGNRAGSGEARLLVYRGGVWGERTCAYERSAGFVAGSVLLG